MRVRVSSAQWLQERARTHAPCRTRTCSDLSRQRHGSASSAYAHACARATHLDAQLSRVALAAHVGVHAPGERLPRGDALRNLHVQRCGLALEQLRDEHVPTLPFHARLAPLVPPTSGLAVLAPVRVCTTAGPEGNSGNRCIPSELNAASQLSAFRAGFRQK